MPTRVRVREARPGDVDEVVRFQDAFDYNVLSEENTRFVSAVEVFHPDKRSELFLNEVAVMERARRRGVARALIDELKRLGRDRGCAVMWVLTDEANAPAMSLYRSTGGVWNGDVHVMFEFNLDD